MKDLREVLHEKEMMVQRLQREIEAIRVVIDILDEEEQPRMSAATPAPTSKAVTPSAIIPGTPLANATRVPPVAPPFTSSASGAQAAPARKSATNNWP